MKYSTPSSCDNEKKNKEMRFGDGDGEAEPVLLCYSIEVYRDQRVEYRSSNDGLLLMVVINWAQDQDMTS